MTGTQTSVRVPRSVDELLRRQHALAAQISSSPRSTPPVATPRCSKRRRGLENGASLRVSPLPVHDIERTAPVVFGFSFALMGVILTALTAVMSLALGEPTHDVVVRFASLAGVGLIGLGIDRLMANRRDTEVA